MKANPFGKRLKAAREAKCLSTRDVETITGISYTSISRYEHEGVDPSFLYMVQLCDLYDIDLNDLANMVRSDSNQRDRYTRSVPNRRIEMKGHHIGPILKAGRIRKRLSTKAVEGVTGISGASISRYETKAITPSFTYTVLMCDLYDLYINDLANIIRNRRKP